MCIPQNKGNVVFHVTSVMLHFLLLRGLFRGQTHEDTNSHSKNFIDVCLPFHIAHITQASIRFHLLLFSLIKEEVLWLRSLPVGCINSRVELTKSFLDRYFLSSRMFKIKDKINTFIQLNRKAFYKVLLCFNDKFM